MLILGEIRGQLRELIHNSNNNAAKLDALAIRVAALEGEKNRREGAIGLANALRVWIPVLVAMIVIVVVVLKANGKI